MGAASRVSPDREGSAFLPPTQIPGFSPEPQVPGIEGSPLGPRCRDSPGGCTGLQAAPVQMALLECSSLWACPLLFLGKEATDRDAPFSQGTTWQEPRVVPGSECPVCPFQRNPPALPGKPAKALAGDQQLEGRRGALGSRMQQTPGKDQGLPAAFQSRKSDS